MPSIDKKKKNRMNKILYIFLTVFFVALVTWIYLATAFTPDIDVDVISSEENSVADNRHQDIDSRLKDIQQDELAVPGVKETESSSDIIAQLKKMKQETIAKQMHENEIEIQAETETQSEPVTQKPGLATPEYTRATKQPAQSQSATSPVVATKMAKVYVGRYSDFEQAAKVQDVLVQSSMASAPFIKSLNGYYVIQVGSYSNMQTAQNIAEALILKGYSARMVIE